LFNVVDYPSAFYCTLNTHYRIVSYHIVTHSSAVTGTLAVDGWAHPSTTSS